MPDPVVLVHGGLYEDVGPDQFWGATGIGAGLRAAGFQVAAPVRPATPRSWEEERDALVATIAARVARPVAIVAASNGCSAALRAVIDEPTLASRLVLCWPVTAGDHDADAAGREMIMRRVSSGTADRLLAGETIRGVLDEELERIRIPVVVVPSEDGDPFHQPVTVDRLRRLLPDVKVLEAIPPAPAPNFRHYRSRFVALLTSALGLGDAPPRSWEGPQ